MATTGTPRSYETDSASRMSSLNSRAQRLTAKGRDGIKELEGLGMRWAEYTDGKDTTYAVVFKEFDGQMTAQISKRREGFPSDKKEVVESYFWNSEAPEDRHQQFVRDLVGFQEEDLSAIDTIISIVEFVPR